MATSCLSPESIRRLKQAFGSKEITIEKLNDMDAAQMHGYFASIIGEPGAKWVSEVAQSKLILKNQKQGMLNGLKELFGEKHPALRDAVSKVNRLENVLKPAEGEQFMADLAAKKLGVGETTLEETSHVVDLAQKVKETKSAIPEGSPARSKERIEYGTALAVFKGKIGDMKLEAEKKTFKEVMTDPGLWVEKISGTLKSMASSWDNSFFGRQGFRTLVDNPDIWMKNFGESFKDIGKELMGQDTMLPTKADVFSRENAINGKYRDIGLDVGIDTEEAFPESLPTKIPLFGRLFKASEAAYNNAALRMRADLADAWIKNAEENGVEIKKEENIGEAINSITGRGKVNLFSPKGQRIVNAAIFSIKYLKSNIDLLTATSDYLIKPKTGEGSFARKKAAQNALKTIGAIAGVLAVAKMLDDKSVELDPRSSRFGKIWVGEKHDIGINISLGAGAIVTLASRLVPTTHNGKLGTWIKNSKGKYVNWSDAKYGQSTGLDLVTNFMTGKSSPFAAMFMSYLKAKDYDFQKPTIQSAVAKAGTPIPAQNMWQLAQSPAGEDPLLYAILTSLDLLGVGVNYQPTKKKKVQK